MAKKDTLNIIFVGTPDFAVPLLKSLLNHADINVAAVITRPDKKSGRGKILTSPPVKVAASDLRVRVIQPDDIREIRKDISNLKPDALVVAAYDQKIPPDILNMPELGSFNLHASLLPKYRGSSCVQAAILNGDSKTGVTVMKMDAGLDTGPTIAQKEAAIKQEDTAGELTRRLADAGAELLPQSLIEYASGKIKPVPQDENRASFVKKLKKDNGRINWQDRAENIERFIRAMSPWPSAFNCIQITESRSDFLKILKAGPEILNINNCKPGQLFDHQECLAVQCGQNALKIQFIQPAGKRAMTGAEFLNGNRHLLGSVLF